MIKLAMIVRSTLYTVRGGDTTQVLQTARSLCTEGVHVDICFTTDEISYDQYDLLHFFNLTRPADILYHVRKSRLPFVVSTILINYSEFDKYYRKGLAGFIFRFLPTDSIEYLKSIGRWVRGNDKIRSLNYLWKGQKGSIRHILQNADLLLPNSESEYRRLQELYSCEASYAVVPNAVDHSLFSFDPQVEKDPHLVLCVARIEGIKNQLNLIRALNNTKFTLLIIGAAAPNQPEYYKSCRDEAAPNICFIDQLDQKDLVAYYQKATVHILPSWFETTGLSSLEAAAMGCNLVITDKGDTREYFGDHVTYCSPQWPESIYEAVEKASRRVHDTTLQTNIAQCFTWQKAGEKTAAGYYKILNDPSGRFREAKTPTGRLAI